MPKDEGKQDKPVLTTSEKIREDKDNLEKTVRKANATQPSPVPNDDAIRPVMAPIYFYVTGRVKVTPDSSNVIIVYR